MEDEKVDTKRAEEWLNERAVPLEWPYYTNKQYHTLKLAEALSRFAESECSRLASALARVHDSPHEPDKWELEVANAIGAKVPTTLREEMERRAIKANEAARLASRVSELDARERHWNFCDKHKQAANGTGVRGGCPECSEAEMAQALYEIDAAAEPNKEIVEHGATLYNLSYDPQVVVKAVKRLASRVEELEAGLRQTIAYLKQEPYAASYGYLSNALEAAEDALAGAHAEEKE